MKNKDIYKDNKLYIVILIVALLLSIICTIKIAMPNKIYQFDGERIFDNGIAAGTTAVYENIALNLAEIAGAHTAAVLYCKKLLLVKNNDYVDACKGTDFVKISILALKVSVQTVAENFFVLILHKEGVIGVTYHYCNNAILFTHGKVLFLVNKDGIFSCGVAVPQSVKRISLGIEILSVRDKITSAKQKGAVL